MIDRPYTLLSCAMSLDGYLSDPDGNPVQLSNAADRDRVDAVRAGSDAILVGAATIRSDNPRLVVRSQTRTETRLAHGRAASPIKVTIIRSGDLDPWADFFTTGESDKLVYCPSADVVSVRTRLGSVATVVDGGVTCDLPTVGADLARRGVRRLMVEGGGSTHTQFSDRGPRRRAAAGHRAPLRGSIDGSAVRPGRSVSLAPWTPSDVGGVPATG